jgi:predicted lipid-binding transport protein (Tim44 family)
MALPQRLGQKASILRSGAVRKALFICNRHLFVARLQSAGAAIPPEAGAQRRDDRKTVQVIIEIVILALIAAFPRPQALFGARPSRRARRGSRCRLGSSAAKAAGARARRRPPRRPSCRGPGRDLGGFPPAIEQGLREISTADRRFDLLSFLEGAKAPTRLVLEAFWRGDKDDLRQLCDDDVYQSFAAAIDALDSRARRSTIA